GGDGRMSDQWRQTRADAQSSPRVRFQAVRSLKQTALMMACQRFQQEEWEVKTIRAADFAGFVARERWWLEEYALFMACVREWPDESWQQWPPELARRDQGALAEARRRFAERIFFEQYVQWIADGQWRQAREKL